MTADPWWLYRARPANRKTKLGVVDGDTLDLVVDLGFGIRQTIRVRLAGVDTAETYGTPRDSMEYRHGKRQAAWVRNWIETAIVNHADDLWPLIVTTEKDRTGKFGRYTASVNRRSDSERLNDRLVAEFPEVSNNK